MRKLITPVGDAPLHRARSIEKASILFVHRFHTRQHAPAVNAFAERRRNALIRRAVRNCLDARAYSFVWTCRFLFGFSRTEKRRGVDAAKQNRRGYPFIVQRALARGRKEKIILINSIPGRCNIRRSRGRNARGPINLPDYRLWSVHRRSTYAMEAILALGATIDISKSR